MSTTTQEHTRIMPGTAGTATTTTTAASTDGKSYTSSTSAGTHDTPSLHAPQPQAALASAGLAGGRRASGQAPSPGAAQTQAQGHAKTDSVAASASSVSSLERHAARYEQEIDRLRSPQLERQRAELTETKAKQLEHLSLGAKIERACARRMVGQDAEHRPISPTKAAHDAANVGATHKPAGGFSAAEKQGKGVGVDLEKALGLPVSEGRSAL